MEVNFDKQIDTILRDLAKGNSLGESPPTTHIDADELSAFAENALPPKARLRAMEHLADCPNCRKTLSIFVSLNSETESETIYEEVKTVPATPWYRRFFAFPNLSYAMGAMALLLVGMVGYLVLQNSQETAKDVAKYEESAVEKTKGPSGASSEGDLPSVTSSANSTSAASNSTAPASNMAAPASNAVPHAANSAANTTSSATVNNSSSEPPKPLATPAPAATLTPSAPTDATVADKAGERDRDKKTATKEESDGFKKDASKQPATETATGGEANERTQTDDNTTLAQTQRQEASQNRAGNQIVSPDGPNERGRNAPAPPPAMKKAPARENGYADEEAKKNKAEPRATPKPSVGKDVGGKTFRNQNGVWIDSAYRGGNTTNVQRNTDQYKKLDSGLRSTADSLGGTVIIVWKGKNYKIQ